MFRLISAWSNLTVLTVQRVTRLNSLARKTPYGTQLIMKMILILMMTHIVEEAPTAEVQVQAVRLRVMMMTVARRVP